MEYNYSEIRIFISSTFKDMETERAHLIYKVFPELRLLSEKRGLNFIPVDLRWGITDEESKSGKVLEICLNEIDNSRPFFIGLLGDRYGWCPTETELLNNDTLKEKWGNWLSADIRTGLSITEIEMQYGVLRDIETLNAIFFVRKGPKDYRVLKLIEKIEKDGRYSIIEYSTLEELGRYVREWYIGVMNEMFPNDESDEIGKAIAAKSAFIASKSLYYYSSEASENVFKAFLNANNHPGLTLCLIDKSGMGKSSWMVNQYLKYVDSSPRELVCTFVDDGFSGGDYRKIVRILAFEICGLYEFEDIDIDSIEPNLLLSIVFAKIPKERPLTVMIDGLNHLEEEGPAKGLSWLPPRPENVTYILSTLPDDRVIDVLNARNSKQSPVYMAQAISLKEEDRKDIVSQYLAIFGKSLDNSNLYATRIAQWPLSKNSFILRALLDDLISFGSHESIHAYIDDYLKTASASAFFNQLLLRYEKEFGQARVSKALALIVYSANGLAEHELMEISKFSQLEWSELRNAIKPFLRTQGTLTSFSHSLMHSAVKERYSNIEICMRSKIIQYFINKENYRSYYEVARQFLATSEWTALRDLLLRYDVFYAFYNNHPYELAYLWQQLLKLKIDKTRPSLSDYSKIDVTDLSDRIRFLLDVATFAHEYCDSYSDARTLIAAILCECESPTFNDNLLIAKVYDTAAEIDMCGTSSVILPLEELKFSYLKASLEIKRKIESISESELAITYQLLGRAFATQDEKKIADYCFGKALRLLKITKGVHSIEFVRCASFWGRVSESPYLVRKVIDMKIKLTGDYHPWLIEDYKTLSKASDERNESRQAAEKAAAISDREFGRDARRSQSAHVRNSLNRFFFKIFDFDINKNSDSFSVKESLGCMKILFMSILTLTLIVAIPIIFILLWCYKGFYAAYGLGSYCLLTVSILCAIYAAYKKRSVVFAIDYLCMLISTACLLYSISLLIRDFSNDWLQAIMILFIGGIPWSLVMFRQQKKKEKLNMRLGFDAEKAQADLKNNLEKEINIKKNRGNIR